MLRKCISSLVLVCVLVVTICTPSYALSNDFSDTSQTDWYYISIGYCSERGIMNGVGNHCFEPNTEVSRAMIVQVLYNLKGTPVDISSPFTDCLNSWFTSAVDWAYSFGIVNGVSKTSFKPNQPITRQDLVTILYRFAQGIGESSIEGNADLKRYADCSQVADYAYDAMSWAVGAGIIAGTSTSTLSPCALTTRAQLATIMMRYCMLSEAKNTTIAVPSQSIDVTQRMKIPVATSFPYGSKISYKIVDSSSPFPERDFSFIWKEWNGSFISLQVAPRTCGWVMIEITNDYNDKTATFTIITNSLTHVSYSDTQFSAMGKEAYTYLLSILKNPASLQLHKVYAAFFEGEPILVFDYSAMNGNGGYTRSERAFWYNDYNNISSGTGSIFSLDRLQDVHELSVSSVVP